MLTEKTELNINQLSYPYSPEGRVIGYQNILRSGIALGDFEGRSHEQLIAIIGNTVERKYQEALGFWQENGRWPQHVEDLIRQKRAQVAAFKSHVEGVRQSKADLAEAVVTKYVAADKATKKEGMKKRIAARLAALSGRVRQSLDLDGTVTSDPNQYLRILIPAGALIEDLLDEAAKQGDPQTLLDVYALAQQGMSPDAPGILRLVGAHPMVDLRRGVERFFASYPDDEKTIITCSCPEFAAGVLDRLPNVGLVRIWGVSDKSSVSVMKAEVTSLLTLEDPTRPLIYIGDGSSDVQALSREMAFYYALSGKSFERSLQAGGYPYLPYNTFDDILEHEEELAYLRDKS